MSVFSIFMVHYERKNSMYNFFDLCMFLNRKSKNVQCGLLMELSNGQVAMVPQTVKALG